MKNNLTIGLFLSLTTAFSACSPATDRNTQKGQTDSISSRVDNAMERNIDAVRQQGIQVADANFISNAAGGSKMEIEVSKIALSKASSAQVKEFAKMMVDDHTKAYQSLKQLTDRKDVRLPDNLSELDTKKISTITKNEGKDFDREYMLTMVKDHKVMSELFQSQIQNGYDSLLKAYASQTLPTILHHLKMAEKINDSMENKAAN